MQDGDVLTILEESGEVMYLPLIRQRVYVSEEVPHCLLANDNYIAVTHAEEWKKRRNPDKAQYDAKEPDRQKFEEEEEEE